MVDYLSVLKAAEKFTDDNTPWDEKFKAVTASSPKEQADSFKLRFSLQLSKQGVDPKELIAKVDAAGMMFAEKARSGNGKSLKYGSVEFSDIIKEFVTDGEMSFVQRKKAFKDFDLNNDGYVDVVEFLMYLYREQIVAGFLARHNITKENLGTLVANEGEAMIKEFVTVPVFVDVKLDEQVLGLKELKAAFEADMQAIKEKAKTEVQQRQLSNNLKARETKYEEDVKGFWSEEQIGKHKTKLLKSQETFLRALEKEIAGAAADALKPKKNLVMP